NAFGGTYTITVLSDRLGEYEYPLNDGPFQSSNVFADVDLGPGGHTITIRDVNGCGLVVIEVGIIYYPPFFTPNNDGYNDTWNIKGLGAIDPEARIFIYDRFGKLLKQISPLGEGWDGTFNGNPLPSSDYWFQTEYKEEGQIKQLRGHFSLKR